MKLNTPKMKGLSFMPVLIMTLVMSAIAALILTGIAGGTQGDLIQFTDETNEKANSIGGFDEDNEENGDEETDNSENIEDSDNFEQVN